MNKSVVQINNGIYKITISAESEYDKKFLEKPISEIQDGVYQHFDDAVKTKLGEKASIKFVKDDSGLPYEIIAQISIENE